MLLWNKLLELTKSEVVGVDVGSSSVKMVQLRKNGHSYRVIAAARIDIDSPDTKQNIETDINVVRAIRQCHHLVGATTRLAVCSVCGPEVAVRYFKFPSLPAEELAPAVQLEAEQVCPFSVSDAVVDYQLIPNGDDCVRGVLVAATSKIIQKKQRLIGEASLRPVLIDIDGLALMNCLENASSARNPSSVAVLNVGSRYCNFVIADEQAVPFVRDTTHAGTSIVRQMAEHTGIDTAEIMRILFNDDEESLQQAGMLTDILEAVCSALAEDVNRALRFYTAQKKSAQVEAILVCGGFARARHFVEVLDRLLPAEAVLWNPLENIDSQADEPTNQLIEKEGPALAVAAGLAMRSI